MNIRTLRADEIECRVQSVSGSGCILLLYKDARADMKILDEVFGIDGWEREHQLIDGKLFCTVRIWSEKRNCWISKQDVGTESNTEKEKGQASDSFKRACVNLGIGRELYSSPFIWINLDSSELDGKKLDRKVKFKVNEIEYSEDREITKLVVLDSNGKERFSYPKGKSYYKAENKVSNDNTSKPSSGVLSEKQIARLYTVGKIAGYEKNIVDEMILKKYSKEASKLDKAEYDNVVNGFQAKIDSK